MYIIAVSERAFYLWHSKPTYPRCDWQSAAERCEMYLLFWTRAVNVISARLRRKPQDRVDKVKEVCLAEARLKRHLGIPIDWLW
jgi:hypothetical protein